jgi:hypothetical protein
MSSGCLILHMRILFADIHFIKELILGDADEAPANFQWRGRWGKSFLYDIVANKRNGIDVDKVKRANSFVIGI